MPLHSSTASPPGRQVVAEGQGGVAGGEPHRRAGERALVDHAVRVEHPEPVLALDDLEARDREVRRQQRRRMRSAVQRAGPRHDGGNLRAIAHPQHLPHRIPPRAAGPRHAVRRQDGEAADRQRRAGEGALGHRRHPARESDQAVRALRGDGGREEEHTQAHGADRERRPGYARDRPRAQGAVKRPGRDLAARPQAPPRTSVALQGPGQAVAERRPSGLPVAHRAMRCELSGMSQTPGIMGSGRLNGA